MEQLTNSTEKITVSDKGAEESSSKDETAGAPSKNALKKAAKEAEKAKKKAETAARLAAQRAAMQEGSVDFSQGKYGVVPLIQSTARSRIVSKSHLLT
jgi:membrane protein involved in colicin uptake